MKKINLEKILEEYRQKYLKEGMPFIDYQILAMKEACRQTLELAAENAKIKAVHINQDSIDYGIDKQSILDTISQIE